MSHSGYVDARQLPITNFAHKAAVVGDVDMRAILAVHDMAAESRRAAALDRAHHLHLAEAHMAALYLTPGAASRKRTTSSPTPAAQRFERGSPCRFRLPMAVPCC
jgi:hypothetical protein